MRYTGENTDRPEGILSPGAAEDKSRWDLRPKRLASCIGQERLVKTLSIAIQAARKREEPLDHILLHGPPGLGKTTFANVIAREMETSIVTTSGPALERAGDLIAYLTGLERGSVLFIDEIHRLPKVVEEFLYPAMEDFAVDFIFDKGAHARSHRFRLERFTLVGATTRPGLLSAPLRERFGITRAVQFYTEDELVEVVKRSAGILEVKATGEGAAEIAKRARGTPRIANTLLKRVRDYAQVKADGIISKEVAQAALELEGVDDKGLTDLDRTLLVSIIRFYKGGPVGLEAIAATLQQESDTIVDMVEPFLLKIGFLARTPSGRIVTEEAARHLNEFPSKTKKSEKKPTGELGL
ncbi:Holliday junction branch migration DNA helicase RuvB [candidate division WOR-3 bacterium]|uniref:Holliday junction branch migration complex subunit RuvB n=1 Tax=candidate division WOR-3 bacterium TaxID=2052148 RepID=A0A9D5KAY4_UNCW3|nr:Holliday junction branch migration DNA helicase RuvB [candidate division WOR-3 bacterium]MBD3365360.1 Holliday junction branch migration DNA helicase RuvB [candidate division WOR-3 bacterium]